MFQDLVSLYLSELGLPDSSGYKQKDCENYEARFLLLPLFLILLLQEIDVLWFSFFVTVSPAEDCVPKFFRVYMPGISGDDLVKTRLLSSLCFKFG